MGELLSFFNFCSLLTNKSIGAAFLSLPCPLSFICLLSDNFPGEDHSSGIDNFTGDKLFFNT